ncbi:hypothetical protein QBZ16_001752 [Prototheca wickerhamii]|uniref:Uncharacterized protein n=1 Tax=Prototheca wickerhamii TaxID=3111 RepID=A0AAD9MFW9_PROWI|nr:hypothetical protein QBZ16_001752 [Prototheca wickerhamii]
MSWLLEGLSRLPMAPLHRGTPRRGGFFRRLFASCLCLGGAGRPPSRDDGDFWGAETAVRPRRRVPSPLKLRDPGWKLPYIQRQRSPLRGIPRQPDPLRSSAVSLNSSRADGPGRAFADDEACEGASGHEPGQSPLVPGAASVPNFASPVCGPARARRRPGSVRAKRALDLGGGGPEEEEAAEDPTTPRGLPDDDGAAAAAQGQRSRSATPGSGLRARARRDAEHAQRAALLKKVSPAKLDRLLHAPAHGTCAARRRGARRAAGPAAGRAQAAQGRKAPADAAAGREARAGGRAGQAKAATGRRSYVDELRSRAAAAAGAPPAAGPRERRRTLAPARRDQEAPVVAARPNLAPTAAFEEASHVMSGPQLAVRAMGREQYLQVLQRLALGQPVSREELDACKAANAGQVLEEPQEHTLQGPWEGQAAWI